MNKEELSVRFDEVAEKIHFFKNLSKKELGTLKNQLVTHRYKKSQVILFQGGRNFGVYFVLSGSVKITRSEKNNRESCLKFLKEGDVFGFENLFREQSFITVQSLQDSVVSFIPKEFFLPFVEENPKLALGLLKYSNDLICNYQERLSYLTQNNAEENLAKVLLDLHYELSDSDNLIKSVENGKAPYSIPLSRSDLASMIGTAQETAIRLLSKFKEEGFIEQEKRKIYVKNVDTIRDMTR